MAALGRFLVPLLAGSQLQRRRPIDERLRRQRHTPAGSQDVLEPIQVVEQIGARRRHLHGCVLFHPGRADR